jgi:pimeloyl-ACP methyl ester carboxylesterase
VQMLGDGMLEKSARKLDPLEEHYWIPSPRSGLQLFLRHLSSRARRDQQKQAVLNVHGGTFPSALSIAHRFDGYSWRDALCEAGFDVWGFDFHGFGLSDRYPEMSEAPDSHSSLCRAEDASEQVATVARFILDQHALPHLSIIAHSWGSIPAGRFAGQHPSLIDRLVLFGPISRRPPRRYETAPSAPAWRIVTVEDQWSRFVEDVPDNEPLVLSRTHFDEWGERYLDTDPTRTRPHLGRHSSRGRFQFSIAKSE